MKITIQNIENLLNYLKERNQELNDIFIDFADQRCGKRIALAKRLQNSTGIRIVTDYLTVQEMNQFLRGYLFKSSNKFN